MSCAAEPLAGGEHRGLAGAKLLRLHLPGLEIVADMLPDPDLVQILDADVAVGGDVAGLLVDADLVSGQESAAVFDQHAVGAAAQTRLEIELRPALIVQRLHFPLRLLLSAQRAGKRQGAQSQREHGAQSCHLARRDNQNPRAVPSGIYAGPVQFQRAHGT